MKKFISLLLALVMVFSMGAIAFAADKEEAPKEESNTLIDLDATLPIVNVSIKQVLEVAEKIFKGVDLGQIKGALDQTIKTLGEMVEAIAPLFDNVRFEEIPAMMMDAFINALAKLFGTDRQGILDALMEIPFIKQIMYWYGYQDPTTAPETTTEAPATEAETEAPVEEVPNTGAAAGVAVFASLSVAAAAAFVSKKKAA